VKNIQHSIQVTVACLGLVLAAGCVVGPPVRVVTVRPAPTLPPSLIRQAERGDPVAQFTLGSCYANGRGVPRNYQEAVRWYYFSARQGYAPAQNRLGSCFHRGLGTPQDLKAAVIWYRNAANQGYAPAQDNLGTCYFYGQGVARNFAEAGKWYRLAADQGNPAAKNHLLALAGRGAAGVPATAAPPVPNATPARTTLNTPATPPEEPASGSQMTVDEIKALTAAGVKPDAIIQAIKESKAAGYSPSDIQAAQQANPPVDPAVIAYMKNPAA
jgi:TPR repeat protein